LGRRHPDPVETRNALGITRSVVLNAPAFTPQRQPAETLILSQATTSPVEFYFDFASPFAWLIADGLTDLAARHQREVTWRPVLLFAVFKALGLPPPMEVEARRRYLLHDMQRSASVYGVSYRHPRTFPAVSPLPARMFYAIDSFDKELAKGFARATLEAHFVHDRDITKPEVMTDVAHTLGLAADDIAMAAAEDTAKAQLRETIDAATAKGMIGSPFVLIDDEPFFGADRLPHMEWWLQNRARRA
jgi:2-hydroxychromene-2-carboxylate isomerase